MLPATQMFVCICMITNASPHVFRYVVPIALQLNVDMEKCTHLFEKQGAFCARFIGAKATLKVFVCNHM